MAKRLLAAVEGIKRNSIGSFEDFFFLTHKGLYQYLSACEEDEQKVWAYLKEIYINAWNNPSLLPKGADLEEWYKAVTENMTDKVSDDLPLRGKITPNQNLDEQFETFFVEIEDELGFLDAESNYENGRKSIFNSRIKKTNHYKWLSVGFVVLLSCFTLILVLRVVESSRKDAASLLKINPMLLQTTKAKTVQKSTEKAQNPDDASAAKVGWNKYKDGWKYKREDGSFILENWLEDEGKIYYMGASGYMAVGEVHIGSQNFTFDQSGELESIHRLTYEIEQNETDLGRQLKQQGRSELATYIVDGSIVNRGGWIYYLSKEDMDALPNFNRLQDGTGVLEEIAHGISGYVLVGEHAWYYKDEKLQYFMTLNQASSAIENVVVTASNERFILRDAQGNQVSNQESESIQVGPRIYNLRNGEIHSVDRIPPTLGSYTFIKSNADYDNNIYTEDGKKFLTQGYWITDMCLVGDELFYATIIRFEEDKKPTSQLYKINVNTKERQEMSGIFEGRVNKMYYYPENAAIFMEYSPIGGEHTFGRVMEYDLGDNKLYLIHDEEQRAEKGASDRSRLNVITTGVNQLYAYIEEGGYNPDTKDMNVTAISTVELDIHNRVEMPQQ